MSVQNFILRQVLRLNKFRFLEKLGSTPDQVEALRAHVEEEASKLKNPPGLAFRKVNLDGVPGEWVIPPEVNHKKVLLYFHGGGYVIGSLNTHRALVSKISLEAKLKVLHVDYRLSPENPYPAAVEDAITVYKWLLRTGYYSYQIILGGDSAGGGLCLSAMVAMKKNGLPQPAAAVLLSPWTDLSGSGESIAEKADKDVILEPGKIPLWGGWYAGDMPLDDPRVSPLYEDLSGLPPVLIQVGTEELLLDDSKRLSKKIQARGGEAELKIWDGQIHVWQLFWPYLPEAKQAIRQIADYIRDKGILQID